MDQDSEHLRLLSIYHKVLGGISAFYGLFALLYLAMGIVILSSPKAFVGNDHPPRFLGVFMIIVGSMLTLMGVAFVALVFLTGRFLAQRKRYLFCLVMACIECLFMPLGTVLGISSLLVLSRESVKKLFAVGVSS